MKVNLITSPEVGIALSELYAFIEGLDDEFAGKAHSEFDKLVEVTIDADSGEYRDGLVLVGIRLAQQEKPIIHAPWPECNIEQYVFGSISEVMDQITAIYNKYTIVGQLIDAESNPNK